MSDENIDIVVTEKGDGTNRLTAALNSAATQAEATATSIDKVTEATKEVAPAASTAADAQTKAATAQRGYIDSSGAYIRLVGSQKDAVVTTAAAQGQLTSAVSATTIEAGRAAAGYGPLNSGLTTAQQASAAAQAAVTQLTAGLAGGATSARAAGVGLGEVGASGNAAAVGLNNGRSAFAGAGAAGAQAATGFTAAGSAAGAAGSAIGAAGAASTTAARAANDNANAHRSLGTAFQGAGQAASQFGGVLAGLGFAVGATQVVKYADSYTQVQNKLRLVTTSQQQLDDVMRQSFKIAQDTATPFSTIAELFGRVQQRATSLRLATSDVGTVVSTLATAFQLSGSSGETASRVIEQFNQSLAKGKPEMQDFKSLIQSTPVVEQAFIAGLREIGVSVTGGLGPALTSGTISMQQLLQAMVRINPTMQVLAQNSVPTVAQGFTRLSNAFEEYIGNANKGGAVTGTLTSALNGLANNMQTVVPIAIALGGVLAFGMVAGAITSIISLGAAFGTLLTALVANPPALAAIAVGLTLAIPLWQRYGDAITSYVTKKMGAAGADQANTAAQQANSAATLANAAATGQLGTVVSSAGTKVQALQQQVIASKAALDAATPGTAQYTAAQEANKAATTAAAQASKQYEDALKALQGQQQANAQAAKTFAETLNKVQNLNAYGEQLETTAQYLERARANQQKFNEQLKATYAPIIASAQALNEAAIAATGYSTAVAQAAVATQTGVSGFDQYGQSAARAAANLQALTGDAGLFTQAELNANSSINQGQSAMESAASSAGNLASAFQSAGAAASFLAVQTKNANTVIGQIGESSGGFSQSYDENFLPLGRGQSGLGQQEIDRQRYSVIRQEEAYKKKLDDMHKQAQRELGVNDNTTAVAQDRVSTAVAANTAAVNRNTSATTSNTAANTNLPDLLTSPVTTSIVPGAGPSGIGVGSTATQITYDNPASTVPTAEGSGSAMPMGGAVGGMGAGTPGISRPIGMGDPAVYGTPNPTVSPGVADPTGLNAVVQAIQDGFSGVKQRPGVANITIKTDDMGQFKRSQRQIGQDLVSQMMGAA